MLFCEHRINTPASGPLQFLFLETLFHRYVLESLPQFLLTLCSSTTVPKRFLWQYYLKQLPVPHSISLTALLYSFLSLTTVKSWKQKLNLFCLLPYFQSLDHLRHIVSILYILAEQEKDTLGQFLVPCFKKTNNKLWCAHRKAIKV